MVEKIAPINPNLNLKKNEVFDVEVLVPHCKLLMYFKYFLLMLRLIGIIHKINFSANF